MTRASTESPSQSRASETTFCTFPLVATLPPQSSATRPIVHLARLDRARERFPVGVRNHQHSSGRGILRDDHYGSGVDGEFDVVEIQ